MQDEITGRGAAASVPASQRKGWSRGRVVVLAMLAVAAFSLTVIAMLVLIVSSNPQTGAQGADWLRSVLGNKPVAELEAVVFTIQDKLNQLKFRVVQSTPSAPWAVSTPGSQPSNLAAIMTPPASGSAPTEQAKLATQSEQGPIPTPTGNLPTSQAGSSMPSGPAATPTPMDVPWTLTDISPMGKIPDEGMWMTYIQDSSGATVAYRTFLQPDAERPYVTAGIVAFDLEGVRLNYVLGISEPVSTASVPRNGMIPASDQQAGILLAAFNGGFKTVHGDYGVYAENTVLVPPTDGLGTVAIYSDGSVRIGEWGKDMEYSPDMLVYRQNCPLMVQDGEINPLVYNNSVNDWGGTISGNIVTFRSGIGISRDGKTLYYFAGNTLTMPSLAKAMQAAGAYQAMQLDINNYYVHFVSFEVQDGKLSGVPLLPKEMYENIDRYLTGFGHDFFYITGK